VDEWDAARSVEYIAAEYGWTLDVVERLTSEQLVAYLDAATERERRTVESRFAERVEAARMGTVFASNLSAYRRWRGSVRRGTTVGPGLTGAALEAAVMRVADQFPSNVVRGAA
jgi:hypothetical protein